MITCRVYVLPELEETYTKCLSNVSKKDRNRFVNFSQFIMKQNPHYMENIPPFEAWEKERPHKKFWVLKFVLNELKIKCPNMNHQRCFARLAAICFWPKIKDNLVWLDPLIKRKVSERAEQRILKKFEKSSTSNCCFRAKGNSEESSIHGNYPDEFPIDDQSSYLSEMPFTFSPFEQFF